MIKYEVGQVIEKFKNYNEGVRFDLSDDGATLMVFFYDPTKEEIEQFKSGEKFEICFTEFEKVIMITVKIGNLNWMDAPYTPHLSKDLTKYQIPNENQGLGLTLVLIDAHTGEIKHMRLIGLSEKFTRRLFGCVMDLKMKEFNRTEYQSYINKVFNLYDTNQIVNMSKDYCKIH